MLVQSSNVGAPRSVKKLAAEIAAIEVLPSKKTEEKYHCYQIDLIFDRDDNVYTICEIKYLQSKVSTSVIRDFEQKLSLCNPKKNKTIHKVLICSEGGDNALINKAYFDDIITFSDLVR